MLKGPTVFTSMTPTLFVSDLDRSVRFFRDVLGLPVQQYGPHWAQADMGGGHAIGLHPPAESGPPPGTRGSIEIGLIVRDRIEDTIAALSSRGVQFSGPPPHITDDGPVRLAFFKDPDGNPLYLCQMKT